MTDRAPYDPDYFYIVEISGWGKYGKRRLQLHRYSRFDYIHDFSDQFDILYGKTFLTIDAAMENKKELMAAFNPSYDTFEDFETHEYYDYFEPYHLQL